MQIRYDVKKPKSKKNDGSKWNTRILENALQDDGLALTYQAIVHYEIFCNFAFRSNSSSLVVL